MPLMELIEQLQDLHAKYGDLEIVVVGSHGEWLSPKANSDADVNVKCGFVYTELRVI